MLLLPSLAFVALLRGGGAAAGQAADAREPLVLDTAQPRHIKNFDPSVAYHQKASDQREYAADIVSIGSETRLSHLQAQVDTWATSHLSVRNFWGFTERQDHDRGCAEMSAEDVATLVRTCRARSGFDPPIAGFVRQYYGFSEGMRDHTLHSGWLCAQRRLGRALGWLQARYGRAEAAARDVALPDLLVFADDDTFMDVERVKSYMTKQARHFDGQPLARAGCVVAENQGSNIAFSFPYGGFGTFLDKMALRKMVQPIKCTGSDATSAVNRRICSVLKADRIGERVIFEEGMTILELFSKYSSLKVYCMHSDWLLGYMVKYYLYGVRPQEPDSALLGMETYPLCGNFTTTSVGKLTITSTRPCKDTAATCHNMMPEDMESMALSSYVRAPDSFGSPPRLAATTMTAVTDMIAKKKEVQEARSRRLLPNVLLIGAQKAGTSSIADWLFSSGVCRPEVFSGEQKYFKKETHFFDQDERYQQGLEFYSRRFEHCRTKGNRKLVMDATPNTLPHPKRVYDIYTQVGTEVLSKVKLIVILREPVSRELSLYNHKKKTHLKNKKSNGWFSNIAFANNNTVMSFEEYSKRVLAGQLSNQNWRSVGMYVDHLKQWVMLFERKQLLVLSYDEVQETPEVAQSRIREFLGAGLSGALHQVNTQEDRDKVSTVPAMARQVLDPLFKKKNLELYQFLDQHPGPSMEQHPFPHFTSDLASTLKDDSSTYVNKIPRSMSTSRSRPLLPNVLLIGAQKAGTSSISQWLFSSGVCRPEVFAGEPAHFNKETHFFSNNERYQQGLEFYSRRFEHCRTKGESDFVMDATPGTLRYAKNVYDTYSQAGTEALTKVKLIVVLREPVSREMSLYNHKRDVYLRKMASNAWYSDVAFANNNTVMSFEEYTKRVLTRLLYRKKTIPTGKYVDHLKQWVLHFERKKLLVLSYDEVNEAPEMAQSRIREFLGAGLWGALRQTNTHQDEKKASVVPAVARQLLDPIFKKKNLELYEFLDQHPGPSMEQHPFPRFASDLASKDDGSAHVKKSPQIDPEMDAFLLKYQDLQHSRVPRWFGTFLLITGTLSLITLLLLFALLAKKLRTRATGRHKRDET